MQGSCSGATVNLLLLAASLLCAVIALRLIEIYLLTLRSICIKLYTQTHTHSTHTFTYTNTQSNIYMCIFVSIEICFHSCER